MSGTPESCPRCRPELRPPGRMTTPIEALCSACRGIVERMPAVMWRREHRVPSVARG